MIPVLHPDPRSLFVDPAGEARTLRQMVDAGLTTPARIDPDIARKIGEELGKEIEERTLRILTKEEPDDEA